MIVNKDTKVKNSIFEKLKMLLLLVEVLNGLTLDCVMVFVVCVPINVVVVFLILVVLVVLEVVANCSPILEGA